MVRYHGIQDYSQYEQELHDDEDDHSQPRQAPQSLLGRRIYRGGANHLPFHVTKIPQSALFDEIRARRIKVLTAALL